MAKCTECGAVVADDLKFCGYCGAKLNIVSEHFGTQILGNTQVIMGALERIAPGAAQQYTVLGTAGDGPLAGGLILYPPLTWSDGEKLTQVAAEHIVGCFERGTFAFNPELTDTCPVCLSCSHRMRRVEPFYRETSWPSARGKSSWDQRVCGWATASFGDWVKECPFCESSRLLSPEYRAYRIQRQEKDLRWLLSLFENSASSSEDLAGRGPRKVRKLHREEASKQRGKAQLLASILDDVVDSVDHDQKVFRAFVATLPSLRLQPPSSLADWRGFQRDFFLMANVVVLTESVEVFGREFTLSPSMGERARARLNVG